MLLNKKSFLKIIILTTLISLVLSARRQLHFRRKVWSGRSGLTKISGKGISGSVYFLKLKTGGYQVKGSIQGLSNGKHGLYISHSKECRGVHFNPFDDRKGYYVGDLGYIESENRFSKFDFKLSEIRFGNERSIKGKSLCIESNKDEFGLGRHKDSTRRTRVSSKAIGSGIIGVNN